MVIEAHVRLRHHGCFTQRFIGTAQGAQLGADRDGEVHVLHGEPRSLASMMADFARLHGPVETLGRTPSSVALRLRAPAHGIPALIAAAGCTIQWPVLYVAGEESYTLLAPTRERLDALLETLARHGDVTLSRATEAPPAKLHVNVPVTDITTNLTERQLIILQRAIQEGYYDSPRRTSTEALAAEFGVTRSTLEEHLRKAERRVLEGFAGVLAAQPVVASAAARRPGRPPRLASASLPAQASS